MRKGLLLSSVLLTGLFSIFSLTLNSCGGSGNVTIGGETSGSSNTPNKTYLAYLGSLYLVDPDKPSQPIEISQLPTNDGRSFIKLNINSENKTYTNLHYQEVYYVVESDNDTGTVNGGPLKRISLIRTNSIPSPNQISNLTDVCSIIDEFDDIENGIAYMVVDTSGQDGQCFTDDDMYYFVNSKMSGTNEAKLLKDVNIIASVGGDLANPKIDGFIVYFRDTKTLEKCNVNLDVCNNIISNNIDINNVKYIARNPNNGNIYLCIDSNEGSFIGKFSVSQNSSVDLIINIDNCSNISNIQTDNNAIYYILKSDHNIYKLSYDSSDLQTLYDQGDAENILAMTKNYLIVRINNQLKAIKKNGVVNTAVYNLSSNEEVFAIINLSDKWLFSIYNIDEDKAKACIWKEDFLSGTNCEDNSYWAGESFATSGNIDVSTGWPLSIYKILKVENATSISQGGGILYAVDPSTLNSKTKLGDLSDVSFLFGSGIGDNLLLVGEITSKLASTQSDIFFVNLSQPNSLQRITNTSNKNEWPITGF